MRWKKLNISKNLLSSYSTHRTFRDRLDFLMIWLLLFFVDDLVGFWVCLVSTFFFFSFFSDTCEAFFFMWWFSDFSLWFAHLERPGIITIFQTDNRDYNSLAYQYIRVASDLWLTIIFIISRAEVNYLSLLCWAHRRALGIFASGFFRFLLFLQFVWHFCSCVNN